MHTLKINLHKLKVSWLHIITFQSKGSREPTLPLLSFLIGFIPTAVSTPIHRTRPTCTGGHKEDRLLHGVSRCPRLNRMTQELELPSVQCVQTFWMECPSRVKLLELLEEKTLIWVSGGRGMNCVGGALGSTSLLLFERKCFQFYKELSFIPKKKGMIQAYTFCETSKGGIPDSLPLGIDY